MDRNSSTSQTSESYLSTPTEITIPSPLKFLISNIKNMVPTQLTSENHHIWSSQVTKIFSANGFMGFLDGSHLCPPKFVLTDSNPLSLSPTYTTWLLIDQNLSATLYSTISLSILPYIVNLNTSKEIWETIAKRLQSKNWSKVI